VLWHQAVTSGAEDGARSAPEMDGAAPRGALDEAVQGDLLRVHGLCRWYGHAVLGELHGGWHGRHRSTVVRRAAPDPNVPRCDPQWYDAGGMLDPVTVATSQQRMVATDCVSTQEAVRSRPLR